MLKSGFFSKKWPKNEKSAPKTRFRGGGPPPGGGPPDKLAPKVDLVLEISTRIGVFRPKPRDSGKKRENGSFSPLISIGKTIFNEKDTFWCLFIDFWPQNRSWPVLCLKHALIMLQRGQKVTPKSIFWSIFKLQHALIMLQRGQKVTPKSIFWSIFKLQHALIMLQGVQKWPRQSQADAALRWRRP